MADAYQLVLLVACIGCAMSATSILVRDPDEAMNRYAAAIVFGGAFWAFCEILWNRSSDPETVMALVKLSALGWIFVGPLGMQLLLEMAGRPREPVRPLLRLLYGLALGLLLVDWTTSLIHERVVQTSWGWSYELGPTYLLFYVITTTSLVAGLAIVGFDMRGWASAGERSQGVGVICGIAVPLVVASITDGLLPLLDVHVWHMGTASIATLGAIVTWTFHHHGYSLLAPGTFAREILATLPDGVMLLHLDGRVRRANPAMVAFAGGSSVADLVGRPVSSLLDVDLSLAEEARHEIETRVVPLSADAHPTPVAVTTRLLWNGSDGPTGVVVVARDLREIVKLRRRVVIGGRMAAVGQLAAGVAHELNNPIAYVRANLSVLLDHWRALGERELDAERAGDADGKPDDASDGVFEEGFELIDESIEGIDRAAAIVRDIRTFSHGAGDEREPTDLTRLLDATLRIASPQLRHRARVERADDPAPVVECAPREIQQVFLNLLINAIDATPTVASEDLPCIRIETRVEGGHVHTRFSDEGDGIAEDDIEGIFDPFFTTKPAGQGTGLGLALSYEIVRRHAGDIQVESEPGQGSCFTVVLPRWTER